MAYVGVVIAPLVFTVIGAGQPDHDTEVEVAIKALGDFTSTVGEMQPGTTVYVDGPHGVFSIDQDEDPASGSSPAASASPG